MMLMFHADLTVEKWRSIPWDKRLLNIAAEMARAKHWIAKKENDLANQSIERALELMDLTVEAGIDESFSFLREFLLAREWLAGFYVSPEKDLREFHLLLKGFLDLEPSIHNLSLEF